MKNVTCRKLLIDRQKAPENLGTLKDITLYGSFEFQHLYCGGKNNNNNKQISIKKQIIWNNRNICIDGKLIYIKSW